MQLIIVCGYGQSCSYYTLPSVFLRANTHVLFLASFELILSILLLVPPFISEIKKTLETHSLYASLVAVNSSLFKNVRFFLV